MPKTVLIHAAINPLSWQRMEKLSKRSSMTLIKRYAIPKQRSWDSTKRILEKNCADWLDKPFTSITKADARELRDKILAEGHGPKARVTLAWLRKLWRWAFEEDMVPTPMIDAIKIDYEKNIRDRKYSDAEIKAHPLRSSR